MSKMTSHRRSARLRETTRKRQLSESQSDKAASKVSSQAAKRRKKSHGKLNLLSLPDDQLSLIMDRLKSSDSSGTFQEPRHAFALAMTNTRLLSLFKEKVIKIAPDLSNPAPPTLSTRHILSVSRVAGSNLRAIHFTECFDDTLKYLSRAFPKLEELSFHDRPQLCRTGLRDLLCLSLQSLTVTNPTPECLSIVPTPRELSLFNVMGNGYNALGNLLRNPPRFLNLSIKCSLLDIVCSTSFNILRVFLAQALPRIESFCIMPYGEEDCGHSHSFAGEAARLVSEARKNSLHSHCMSIQITGWPFFHLLNQVDSNAAIELSDGRESFFDSGNGIHAQKLLLGECYVETDVSRLEEVTIGKNCSASWEKWKELLFNVKLSRAFVLDLHAAKHLCLNIEIVDIPIQSVGGNHQWAWLADAKEVNLIGIDEDVHRAEQLNVFRGITSILRFLSGNVLWISELEPGCFTTNCNDIKTRRAVKALINAVKKFEKSGGDAGTIKAMINCALTRWSIERSDL